MPVPAAAALARRPLQDRSRPDRPVSLTTIAVAGPDRSGVAAGVPVPRSTTFVDEDCDARGDCSAECAATTTEPTTIAVNITLKRVR
jgi:hypothetical protein